MFDMCETLREISEVFGDEIAKQDEMRGIIDSFYAKTNVFIKVMFWYFFLGFFVPFIVQVFLFDKASVKGLNILCLVTQSSFMFFEMCHWRKVGTSKYF